MDLYVVFVGSGGCMEGFVERGEKSFSPGYAKAGMLAFANEGFEGLEFDLVGAESVSDGCPEGVHFLLG